MGERRRYRIRRAIGAAALVAAASVVLSSCSALGGPGGSPVASSSADVVDPSVQTPTPTPTVASDTPAPIASDTPTPAATSTAAPVDGKTSVTPFITTADYDASGKALDVSAIVPNVIEAGGTCTVTITSAGTTRTATANGVAASSYTGCEAVSFAKPAAGTWTVTVRYSSTKAAGTSAARTVQVG